MFPSYILSLREGLEAALIIGIVLGALRQVRHLELKPALWAGTASAILVSLAAGIGLSLLGFSLEGKAEQVFEGITMLLAAGILTWMIFWMNRQSHNLKGNLETGVTRAAAGSGKRAIFALAFFAVVREGIELALFLTAAAFASDANQTILGALLGLGTAVLLGWSLFATTVRLDLRRFFQVTGFLLILFAAGLIAHGVHEFNEVGWIPALIEHVWDVNAIMDETSTFGLLLKALFGYNGNPSLTEMLAYAAYFVAILFGLRLANKPRPIAANQQT
ncbi:MAG: hypothetical protein FJZ96_04865 [Chloroflexi bacterium]|nr:hypothetical protein [Chloroflexota bacterium]